MTKAARVALISGSSLAFPLAFPPCSVAWILAFVWPCFLLGLRGLSPSAARGFAFAWGMIAFGVGVTWFWNIFEARALSLCAILAIFPALFAGTVALAEKRGWVGMKLVGFTTLAWTSFEFIRCEIFWLKFPWLSIGSAIGPNLLHPIIGTYGVGFVLIWGLTMSVQGRGRSRNWGWAIAVAIIGLEHLPNLTTPGPGILRVCGIQAEAVAPEEYLLLTEAAAKDAQIVIWPEYAVPFDLRKSTKLLRRISDFSEQSGATMVVGTQTETSDGKWHNTALTFKGSVILGEHHKVHTVHMFADGTPGTTASPVSTTFGKVGTPICFDCDFQDVAREMTVKGAEFFIVPIMDAKNWGLRQHQQHAQLFRLRAAENRRWMAVVGTSGVSQIIDPYGKVTTSITPMKPGILSGSVEPRSDLTIYTRFGWLLPCCQFPIFGWMWVLLMRRR